MLSKKHRHHQPGWVGRQIRCDVGAGCLQIPLPDLDRAGSKLINAKSLMGVLSLGAGANDEVTLSVNGGDERKPWTRLRRCSAPDLPTATGKQRRRDSMRREFKLECADGKQLYARVFEADLSRGVLCVAHGLGETATAIRNLRTL